MKEGYFYALLAALLWGFAPIVEKMGLTRLSPWAGLTIRSLGITIVLLVLSFFRPTWQEVRGADVRSLVFIVVGGLLAGLIAQWLYYGALQRMEASTVAPVVGSYPFFAFILGIVLLGEGFSWTKAIGSVLILGGLVLLKF